jgi:hypothetical protein
MIISPLWSSLLRPQPGDMGRLVLIKAQTLLSQGNPLPLSDDQVVEQLNVKRFSGLSYFARE